MKKHIQLMVVAALAAATLAAPGQPALADNCYVESPNVPNCVAAVEGLAEGELYFVSEGPNQTTVIEIFPAPVGMAVDPAVDPNAPTGDVSLATPDPTDGPLPAETMVPFERSSTNNCFKYGNARAEVARDGMCPPLHWARNNATTAYAVVEDHTGSRWSVYSGAIYWAGNARFNVTYTRSCSSSYHCVKVYEGNYGATGWLGITRITYDGYHHMTSVQIQFNNSYSTTAAQRAQAACHEQGHAFGLGHNVSNASCMYGTATGNSSSGTSDDMNQLTYNTYDH